MNLPRFDPHFCIQNGSTLPVDLVSKSDATAVINNLAKAFRKWLKAHFPDGKKTFSEKEIKASVALLRARLVAFLKTTNSGK